MAAPRTLIGALVSLVGWFMWMCFLCTPFGGLYYLIKSHLANTARLRNKTLQGRMSMLHYVETSDGWKLALVRYPAKPSALTQQIRNCPVLLIHGLSANRMAFDIEDGPSLARTLTCRGFDVWVLEMRGSNLSFHPDFFENPQLQHWDFDDYLEKDFVKAVEFILSFTGARQLHTLGHSMGGLLSLCYPALSPATAKQIRSVTLMGSTITYFGSGTTYQKVIPLYTLAKLFPSIAEIFIPHGLVSQVMYLIMGRNLTFLPFYSFQCNSLNVEPAIVRKLYRFGFHTIPLMLLVSLASAVRKRNGMCDRNRRPYVEHMQSMVNEGGAMPPILLLGGEVDQQCPTCAVDATAVKLKPLAKSIKVRHFGKSYGEEEDYGHFDFLVGRNAEREVFPTIVEFLIESDGKDSFNTP